MIYQFPDQTSVKFHVSAKDSLDNLEVYEIKLNAGGTSIEPHFHEHTEEFFYVMSGALLFHIDGREFILNQGESYLVKRRVAHGFRAINCDSASVLCSSSNQGRMEKYISTMEMYISTQQMNQENMQALTKECDQKRIKGIHEFADNIRGVSHVNS